MDHRTPLAVFYDAGPHECALYIEIWSLASLPQLERITKQAGLSGLSVLLLAPKLLLGKPSFKKKTEIYENFS